MNSRGRFFIVFIITCIIISVLFYLVFRHTSTPLIPYSYLPKTVLGLPGFNKKPVKHHKKSDKKTHKSSDCNDNKRGKPLPEPKMPKPPVPLIVKVAPPGPPIKKPMMT